MNGTSVEIRQASSDDLPAIRDLIARVSGEIRPLRHDRWKLFGPAEAPHLPMVAFDGDRVVGLYVLQSVQLSLAGRAAPGFQAVDAMVDPAFRRRGLFASLAKHCFAAARAEGAVLIYAFPNTASYRLDLAQGWTHLTDITRWVRLIRPPLIAHAIELFSLTASGRPREHQDIEFRLGMPAEDELNRLLDGPSAKPDMNRIVRSRAWLMHRYATESECGYEWLGAYRAGELAAAAVWGKRTSAWTQRDDHRAGLMELFGRDGDALKAVTGEVVRCACQRGSLRLEALCQTPSLTAVLQRNGFHRSKPRPIVAYTLDNAIAGHNVLKNMPWEICAGDFDGY